jgi:dimeric dUTPase (all-alpha-NTP-PPase superfamily)
MNTDDIKSEEKDVKDILPKIWQKQNELVVKYKEIEKIERVPVNLNLMEDQILIKDFKQRITEELAESYEAYLQNHMNHFYEEIIDALHFAVELNILCNVKPEDFTSIDGLKSTNLLFRKRQSLTTQLWEITYRYGLVCNSLKMKPWKQTHVLTDKKKFRKLVIHAFESVLQLMLNIELSGDDIYNWYFKKNAVNNFRIRSKY